MNEEKEIRPIPEEPIIASIEKNKVEKNKKKAKEKEPHQKTNSTIILIACLCLALVGAIGYIFYMNFLKEKPTCPLCKDCSVTEVTPTPSVTPSDPLVGTYTYQEQDTTTQETVDYTLSIDDASFTYIILRTFEGEIKSTVMYIGNYEKVDKLLTLTANSKTVDNIEVEMTPQEVFSFRVNDDQETLDYVDVITFEEKTFSK